MKASFSLALSTAVVLGMAVNSNAALLYHETFDYAPGPVNAAGTDWTANAHPTFESGSLTYPGLASSGGRLANNEPHDGTTASAVNDLTTFNPMFSEAGTYYITLLGRVQDDVPVTFPTDLNGLGVPAYISGKPLQTAFQADGEGNLRPQMEVASAANMFGSFAPQVGTFMMAIRVVNEGTAAVDDVRMVMNPDLSQGEPDWNSADITITSRDLTSPAVEFSTVRFDRAHEWDELRVATKWGEAIPEPASLALLGLGGLAMLRRRR